MPKGILAFLVAGLVSLAGLASPLTAGSPAAVERSSERGQLALAGWVSVDPQAGEEHFQTIVTSGPLDGPADVEFSSYDIYPITCSGGGPGQRVMEGFGLGSGALVVQRDLGGASLAASVSVTTIRSDYCEGTPVQPSVTELVTSIDFELVGEGPRWTERTGGFSRIPSLQTSHEHARIVARDATGTLRVGDISHPLVFGDFGRMTGTRQASTHTESAVAKLRGMLPLDALRAEGAMETGSLQRAGATWEQTGPNSYRAVFVGAERPRVGDSVVYMESYNSTTIVCADGSEATRDVIRSGQGPGTLVTRGHHGSARATGLLDIATIVSDGCTGATTTSSSQDVPVALALTATGLTTQNGEWISLHNPPGAPRRTHVTWSGRSATGSLAVSAERHESTWGEIGTLRWRQQVAS